MSLILNTYLFDMKLDMLLQGWKRKLTTIPLLEDLAVVELIL